MPCAVDYPYEDDRRLQIVTRAACDMAKILRAGYGFEHLAPETKEWIRKHDEEDAANKKAAEEAEKWHEKRLRILEQLSPEHRRILGLG